MGTVVDLRLRGNTELKLTNLASAIAGELIAGLDSSKDFVEVEKAALAVGNEAVRIYLEHVLQKRADAQQPEEVVAWGSPVRRHHPGSCTYFSLVGKLRVRRWTYRFFYDRNGPTVVPLDVHNGLIAHCTPALAKSLSFGHAKVPIRSYLEDMEKAHRCAPPRATAENIARTIASDLNQRGNLISAVREKERLPRGTSKLIIGIDRTSIPMEEDLPDNVVALHRRKRRKPRVRAAPGPVQVSFRMAYVGTVTFVDRRGEVLRSHRFAAFPEKEDVEWFCYRLFGEVEWALQRKPSIKIAVVQDGATELWNLARRYLLQRAKLKEGSYFELVDFFHLIERLRGALDDLALSPDHRSQVLERWREQLLADDRGAESVLGQLRRLCTRTRSPKGSLARDAIGYMRTRLGQMNYAAARRRRIPLGSGATEGACKSLIAARLKRSGQRWRPMGARGVLFTRALYLSDRFDSFWNFAFESFIDPRIDGTRWIQKTP